MTRKFPEKKNLDDKNGGQLLRAGTKTKSKVSFQVIYPKW